MAVGNTFGATALSSYGGFWISFAIILTPGGFEIEAALTEKGAAPFLNSFGLYLMGWFIFTFILLLCTLRSTVAFFLLFFTLDMTFMLLGIGYLQADAAGPKSSCIVAGGAFGLMAAFLAWYNALAGLADSTNRFVVPLGQPDSSDRLTNSFSLASSLFLSPISHGRRRAASRAKRSTIQRLVMQRIPPKNWLGNRGRASLRHAARLGGVRDEKMHGCDQDAGLMAPSEYSQGNHGGDIFFSRGESFSCYLIPIFRCRLSKQLSCGAGFVEPLLVIVDDDLSMQPNSFTSLQFADLFHVAPHLQSGYLQVLSLIRLAINDMIYVTWKKGCSGCSALSLPRWHGVCQFLQCRVDATPLGANYPAEQFKLRALASPSR